MAIQFVGNDPETGEQMFIDTSDPSGVAKSLAEINAAQDKHAPLSNIPGTNVKDTSKLPGISRKKAQFRSDVAGGLSAGLQLTSQPAGTPSPFSAESVLQVGAATALGFAVGGPAGGVTALVAGGLNAFLNSRAEKRRRKLAKETVQIARKAEKERQAREDRFRQINRLDALEAQRFDRKQLTLQSQWKGMQTVNDLMINLINSNESLKNRFVRSGF